MHKINKIPDIPLFSAAVERVNSEMPAEPGNHAKRWNYFKTHEMLAHHMLLKELSINQHTLCAYCELHIELKQLRKTQPLIENPDETSVGHEIEHFMPKSLSTREDDYIFKLDNLLLCCSSGTQGQSSRCGKNKQNTNPAENNCLNPYKLPDASIFCFEYTPNGGVWIMPDEEACKQNNESVTAAQGTINLLNLNDRWLRKRRAVIWDGLDDLLGEALEAEGAHREEMFEKLQSIFDDETKSFCTMRQFYKLQYQK
jgi:uncharacterized protein (TIGR02646 family)